MRIINTKTSTIEEKVIDILDKEIVGQEEAKQQISQLFNTALSPLYEPRGTMFNVLLHGPTGNGKTSIPLALAKGLYGVDDAYTKVDGEQMQSGHEYSKLFGSPPGYVGYEDKPALDSSNLFEGYNKGSQNNSIEPIIKRIGPSAILIIDEIEKASSTVKQSLLSVLDSGVVTLGNGNRVNLGTTMVFMTSNIGQHQISNNKQLGFVNNINNNYDSDIHKHIKKEFSPEFLGRLDAIIKVRALSNTEIDQILARYIESLHDRIMSLTSNIDLKIDHVIINHIKDTRDSTTGVRGLIKKAKKVIESPLANALNNDFYDEDTHHCILTLNNGHVELYEINVTPKDDWYEYKLIKPNRNKK